jgi:amino acid transporter
MKPDEIIGKNESIVAVYYRHWYSVMPIILVAIGVSILSLVGIYLIAFFGKGIDSAGEISGVIGLLALMALSILLAVVGVRTSHRSGLIITNKNLYKIVQMSLLDLETAQFNLTQLQDVKVSQHGLMANLFDVGSVTVETGAQEENFVFNNVRYPRQLAKQIMDCHWEAVGAENSPSPQS